MAQASGGAADSETDEANRVAIDGFKASRTSLTSYPLEDYLTTPTTQQDPVNQLAMPYIPVIAP